MQPTNTTKPPRLLRFKGWCIEQGFAYSSMREAVLRGDMPIVRMGRVWYVDRRDGERFIESRKESSPIQRRRHPQQVEPKK